jgi:UPF0716 protein FxsA
VFFALLAIFIIAPLIELWVIFSVGSQIGFLNTFLVLILISIAGAALARQQGFRLLTRIQEDVRQGRMPGDSLLDGALVLAAAVLLLAPGFVTDVIGILLLTPPVRVIVRRRLKRGLENAVRRKSIRIWPGGGPGPYTDNREPTEPEQRRKELEP